jgi:hypothetical protein
MMPVPAQDHRNITSKLRTLKTTTQVELIFSGDAPLCGQQS